MKVSIVIPCRDGAATLRTTIASALDQTQPAFEIIVVDDGSRDRSATIAASFGARVSVVRATCGSAAAARGLGAAKSGGDALLFLDADDLLGPEALAGLTSALEQHPASVACCAWQRLELIDGQWLTRPPSCAPHGRDRDDLAAWLGNWYHPPCSVLWSRAAYERSGGWNPRTTVNDDGELMLLALARGVELVRAPFGRSYYRRATADRATLSGERTERHGVESRIAVLETVSAELERRGTRKRYDAALGLAFDGIAADCRGRHPDLERSCRRAAKRYAGVRFARAFARWRHRREGSFDPAAARVRPEVRTAAGAARHAARPVVSVILPTYQRAHTLGRALASVLAQTFQDYELLVIDDASTDDTVDVIARFDDPRLRYLRQDTNRGVAAARNRGLAEARGEFVAFLDSDDEWLPRKLARQLEVFEQHGVEVGLVSTGIEVVDAEGATRCLAPTQSGDIQAALLLDNVVYGGGSSVMLRRGVVERAGTFDETLHALEDYDYWLRIAQFYRVEHATEPLARYHDASAVVRRSRDLPKNLAARDRLYARYGPQMARAGVAHCFLLETARRELRAPGGDARAGRRRVVAALSQRPTAVSTYPWLLYMLFPEHGRRWLRKLEARLRGSQGTAWVATPPGTIGVNLQTAE